MDLMVKKKGGSDEGWDRDFEVLTRTPVQGLRERAVAGSGSRIQMAVVQQAHGDHLPAKHADPTLPLCQADALLCIEAAAQLCLEAGVGATSALGHEASSHWTPPRSPQSWEKQPLLPHTL